MTANDDDGKPESGTTKLKYPPGWKRMKLPPKQELRDNRLPAGLQARAG